ncbi:hypothetical protein EK904_012412 [Melospiza melodia maxima]|nr:hypothetical protein EK904_012412 [Melospiza melodia maxima]
MCSAFSRKAAEVPQNFTGTFLESSSAFKQEQHLEPFKYNLKSSTTVGTGGISQPPWGRWWLNVCGIHLAEVQHVRLCTPELRAAAVEGSVWESC